MEKNFEVLAEKQMLKNKFISSNLGLWLSFIYIVSVMMVAWGVGGYIVQNNILEANVYELLVKYCWLVLSVMAPVIALFTADAVCMGNVRISDMPTQAACRAVVELCEKNEEVRQLRDKIASQRELINSDLWLMRAINEQQSKRDMCQQAHGLSKA